MKITRNGKVEVFDKDGRLISQHNELMGVMR